MVAQPSFTKLIYPYKNPKSIDDLVTQIKAYYPSVNLKIIHKAYELADKAHKGQCRVDGSPYITHPLCVAFILADLKLDVYTIAAGLLHDVVEDTKVTLKDIELEFNQTVAFLVDGVSKISQIHRLKQARQKDNSENMRKMLVAMAKDIRVILIKLADRLHNMRTLKHLPVARRLKMAQETLDIYGPLASRLGMFSMKMELEDLAFEHVDLQSFRSLLQQVDSEKKQREGYIKRVIKILKKQILNQTKLKVDITGRPKNLYSIHRKMVARHLEYHQVYDVLAFRVCVNKVEDCYKILGLVHSLWKPIPGRFKDFIAIPKINNYRSLHTTVLGEQSKRIEIQIKTHQMHALAERGIAAHWKYKTESWDNKSSIDNKTLQQFNWLQDLVNLHQQNSHSGEFIESIKMDLFDADVYVFTPQGDVKELPKGATPIDLAYCVHTDLGQHITGAKVNKRMVPLKHTLKSGDTVEVLTSKNQTPSEEWLKYCVTSKAKSKIKAHIKKESRKSAIEIGKKILEKEILRKHLKKSQIYKQATWTRYMKRKNISKIDDIHAHIGYGKILVKDILAPFLAVPDVSKKPADKVKEKGVPSISKVIKDKEVKAGDGCCVIVDDINDVMVSFAKCCRPIPGDSVTGFIRRGHGVVVHRQCCRYLLSLDSERYVDVQWNTASQQKTHVAVLKVVTHDTPGVLKSMSEVFASQNVNIFNLKAHLIKDRKSICVFSVAVKDVQQLHNIMQSLKAIKSVLHVMRSE